jgi:hypothetical protein
MERIAIIGWGDRRLSGLAIKRAGLKDAGHRTARTRETSEGESWRDRHRRTHGRRGADAPAIGRRRSRRRHIWKPALMPATSAARRARCALGEALPGAVDFVGGHLMGKQHTGIAAADADLFKTGRG